jgi:hypothetical protein
MKFLLKLCDLQSLKIREFCFLVISLNSWSNELTSHFMRLEVFTTVKMMMFFWVLAPPCRLVGNVDVSEEHTVHFQD